jgi:indole-3-glycerol phosphate synthase
MSASDLLNTVVAAAQRSADERESRVSRAVMEREAAKRQPNGAGFRASLAASGIRIIAECKRRSPSRGVLRAIYDPVVIARGYEANGAAAISVLTEPTFFDGDLDHLRRVRDAVSIPLLRKDFIVTDYQVVEAAAAGADAVLLIVAALDDAALVRLRELAATLGLAALVEVHDREELERALAAGADVVGVNSRNLRTLAVDTATLDEVGTEIPGRAGSSSKFEVRSSKEDRSILAVAESGLKTPDDLRRLAVVRYDAFLIGERFMTVDDPGAAMGALRAEAEGRTR